ncbi:hypothetical protein STRCI_001107 [Streptomyces cinnabarinus]|uniref:Ig-like domain-containing protein n=1 Tax=Streptomyces cinnabarinus TaxID=67287 RepID=A0ABY7KA64_9ACTN|nr:hypothetical protein [Streptomyces cinnabarinus]WAZ20017.1 hypothetical protein STRCI_001107 [Streptomyces cinnabarinus]
MTGLLLHFGATMTCAHPPGLATLPAPTQQRVLVLAQPVATTADTFLVTGCGLATTGAVPCATIRWTKPAARVFVNGVPALLQPAPPPSPGAGLSTSSPPAPPLVQAMQIRVWGM